MGHGVFVVPLEAVVPPAAGHRARRSLEARWAAEAQDRAQLGRDMAAEMGDVGDLGTSVEHDFYQGVPSGLAHFSYRHRPCPHHVADLTSDRRCWALRSFWACSV